MHWRLSTTVMHLTAAQSGYARSERSFLSADGSEDGDAVVDSDDQASDDMAISSDGSDGDADDDNELSDHDGEVMAVAGVDSGNESEDSSEDENDSGHDFDYGSEENSDDETSSDEG